MKEATESEPLSPSPTSEPASPPAPLSDGGGEAKDLHSTGDSEAGSPVLEPEAGDEGGWPGEIGSPDGATRVVLPARMLNEFVYCPRLFYYEFVEGIFVENADTARGSALHARVDSGNGAMPQPAEGEKSPEGEGSHETIHSRSVLLGSERLGITAKIDLVEARIDGTRGAVAVAPVDYKAGAPRPGQEGNDLWDTDRMQLGLQCLLLRENGYECQEGLIYYSATRQRVRLPFTPDLESWILGRIEAARACAAGTIPMPLSDSPKCLRCSLAPVCLPDETRYLQDSSETPASEEEPLAAPLRRLIAPREETRPLYLSTQGLRVGISDENLQVREKKTLREEVRLRDLCHVALFGNVQLSTQAIQGLCYRDIPISYFSTGGWFYGITRGHDLRNVFLRIEQFRTAADPLASLALARRFIEGKIRNQRTMLLRNHQEPPASTLAKLRRLAESARDAASTQELLGIEGAAAALYFGEFAGMLRPGEDLENPNGPPNLSFQFQGRNRRPPTDPVNALLSLSYSLLSKDCTIAALSVGFDPYVGFYHQPRFGRPALALDFMEEFRPLIADSAVLLAVNNRIITEKDFLHAGKAVSLSAAARKRFFPVYEKRMSWLITHPLFGYKVSYRRAIELQCRIAARTIAGEISCYTPFLTR